MKLFIRILPYDDIPIKSVHGDDGDVIFEDESDAEEEDCPAIRLSRGRLSASDKLQLRKPRERNPNC